MVEVEDVVRQLAELGFDPRPHASGRGWVLRSRGRRAVPAIDTAIETYTSEDDSASATTDVRLDEHCAGVAELAGRFSEACGLPPGLIADLEFVGHLHDLGKADPRFQAWLFDGNALAAQLAPAPVAKSSGLPDDARERERARRRAGYPRGARHELVSVRLVESGGPDLLDGASDRDLVLHLIASHHGRCRPLAPVTEDAGPVEVSIEYKQRRLTTSTATGLHRLDSGVAERFWRLVRRYGWWGLAFFEALLRLADHRRSESEDSASQAAETQHRRASA